MKAQLKELLMQSLETELGGVAIYTTALNCAKNEDLRKEWTEYLSQTKRHVEIMETLLESLGIDSNEESPGRSVVRHIGESLVKAMEMAKSEKPEAAELVACECVVLAETKDHTNWHLLSHFAKKNSSKEAKAIRAACDEVEDQEDEHLYHTRGWCRELWIDSLGLPAVLPPPEEEKDVKTEIGAARAAQARDKLL
jgi:rubrerythrin